MPSAAAFPFAAIAGRSFDFVQDDGDEVWMRNKAHFPLGIQKTITLPCGRSFPRRGFGAIDVVVKRAPTTDY